MENNINIQQPSVNSSAVSWTYAGFWWRFLAYIIDSLVLSFVTGILFLPVTAVMGISLFSFMDNPEAINDFSFFGPIILAELGMVFTSMLIQWLYFALMESSKYQATLGKMALGIKVTDMEGNRINFGRATGRHFAKILSSFILMIGYIMAGFTAKKQALHDILANCLVIKTR
ncbi:MAG: RDD family protein [Bacteroidales bacterium]